MKYRLPFLTALLGMLACAVTMGAALLTIGGNISPSWNPSGTFCVIPVSGTCDWKTCVAAGLVATRDGATPGTVTNPLLDVTRSGTSRISRDGQAGTTLRLALSYTGTPSADPVVQVWGRSYTAGVAGRWQLLKTKAGATSATLTTAVATDATDGTLFFSVSDQTTHSWDCDGCDELIVAVTTAYAVSAGVTTATTVQFKII